MKTEKVLGVLRKIASDIYAYGGDEAQRAMNMHARNQWDNATPEQKEQAIKDTQAFYHNAATVAPNAVMEFITDDVPTGANYLKSLVPGHERTIWTSAGREALNRRLAEVRKQSRKLRIPLSKHTRPAHRQVWNGATTGANILMQLFGSGALKGTARALPWIDDAGNGLVGAPKALIEGFNAAK